MLSFIRNKLKIENGRVEKNDILKLLKFKNHYQIDNYEILSSSVIILEFFLSNFLNKIIFELKYDFILL